MARHRKLSRPCHVGYSRLYRRDLLGMRISVFDPLLTLAVRVKRVLPIRQSPEDMLTAGIILSIGIRVLILAFLAATDCSFARLATSDGAPSGSAEEQPLAWAIGNYPQSKRFFRSCPC